MGFELVCTTLLALIVGAVICFGGYRLFIFLLPFWGFFFGFLLGVQTLQALFGIGFLATVTSWVFGFVVGVVFAVLAYLFYAVAIAIIAGSLGYGIGAGFVHLIGIDFGLLVFILGLVVAVVAIILTFLLNLQKYVIVVVSAFGGAGIVIGTLLLGPGGIAVERAAGNPIRPFTQGSVWWTILYLCLGVAGVVVQLGANRDYELEPYENRF